MRELTEILAGFDALCAAGRAAALATVVRVEGSAYRRPGARMLVAEDGGCWGCVSGGCLERDVVRRGIGVIATGRPVVARYDTTDDEALAAAGVATGCRGVVEVYIERVDGRAAGPLGWMGRVVGVRRSCAIATVVRGGGVGKRLMVDEEGGVEGELAGTEIGAAVVERVALEPGQFAGRVLEIGGCEVFVEWVAPAQGVVIFGGGPDVAPVVRMGKEVGWHVTVVAARPATGLAERFAAADRFLVTPAEEPVAGVAIGADAAVVLMTHNFPRDVRILAGLGREPRYLGILGPRARTGQLLEEVGGAVAHWDVRGPIGLDIGAESPEEIALAVVGEIAAVVRGAAAAGFLRDRVGPIHERGAAGGMERDVRGSACGI